MKLLLFDIDGTLIRSRGAGRAAMIAALEELFGTAGPVDSYHMGGKTDPRIITDLLIAAGVEAAEIERRLPEIFQVMTEKAHQIFPARRIALCPGVVPLLSALDGRDDVLLGLLTGNIRSTAPLKLAAAGIDPTRFRVGAYGSDAIDRNQLPAVALQRASQLLKREIAGNNTVIIGDTPADVMCARAGKATAVAVASGWHSAQTLARYQPDYLLDNLVDTDATLRILLA
ncbi:MAG: HAD family hydrolase [Anaerolineae bacterium]